jgi:hypothetical protein
MDTPTTNLQLRDFTDRLESLHSRMDKFYEWSAVLQKEIRNLQQRLSFLESQCDLDLGQGVQENSILERLEKIKQDRS